MCLRRLVLVVIVLLAAAASWSESRPTSLSEARAAVEANMRSAEGKAYDERFGKEFFEKYKETIHQCKLSTGTDPENFWTLAKLAADGKVQEVLLYPDTKIGACERQTLLKDRFSTPPRDAYWVSVYLKFK